LFFAMLARSNAVRALLLIAFASLCAGCGGGGGSSPSPIATTSAPSPSPSPSGAFAISETTTIPTDGQVALKIPPQTGYSGTITLPVYGGVAGTASEEFSSAPQTGTALPSGSSTPYDVMYVCVALLPLQVPSGAPFVDLTFSKTPAPAPTTVGFAYLELSGTWLERYGSAPYSSKVHITAVDAVLLSTTGTCFALFLT